MEGSRGLRQGLSRRWFVSSAAVTGLAAAAAGLVGCSSSNKPSTQAAKATASAAPVGQSTAAAAATAGSASRTPAAAAAVSSPTVLASTAGKPGGTFVVQGPGNHGAFNLVAQSNPTNTMIAGLVHSGLLAFNYGRPPSNGVPVVAEPDVAQTMPEQPDQLSYVYKLRPGVKFHNGRDVTADDVKYSFEQFASKQSNRAAFWQWFDSVQTPDAQTAVIKSKTPYADGIVAAAAWQDAFILSKDFQEGPDVATKLMGSGPYLFDTDTVPVSTTLKKNPNYYAKPYPYFDQVTVLGATDAAKQVADFSSRQVHLTYWQAEQPRDQIKQNRPDARVWPYPFAGYVVTMRVDQPPFNDARVRQALSMALNRKAIRDAVNKGEGEEDQVFSPALGPTWGFRRPRDLGAPYKYWQFDAQGAKQLLSAAGIDKPVESQLAHYDASVIGQAVVDTATLVEAQWKEAAVANIKDVAQTLPQIASTVSVGNFDGMGLGPGRQYPVAGAYFKNLFWSPPGGVQPPTPNAGHINDQQLSALLDKQLTQLNQDDRRQTFRSIEDIFAQQMYAISLSTYSTTYFTDPSLRNNVAPLWGYAGSLHYVKYWWFA